MTTALPKRRKPHRRLPGARFERRTYSEQKRNPSPATVRSSKYCRLNNSVASVAQSLAQAAWYVTNLTAYANMVSSLISCSSVVRMVSTRSVARVRGPELSVEDTERRGALGGGGGDAASRTFD